MIQIRQFQAMFAEDFGDLTRWWFYSDFMVRFDVYDLMVMLCDFPCWVHVIFAGLSVGIFLELMVIYWWSYGFYIYIIIYVFMSPNGTFMLCHSLFWTCLNDDMMIRNFHGDFMMMNWVILLWLYGTSMVILSVYACMYQRHTVDILFDGFDCSDVHGSSRCVPCFSESTQKKQDTHTLPCWTLSWSWVPDMLKVSFDFRMGPKV